MFMQVVHLRAVDVPLIGKVNYLGGQTALQKQTKKHTTSVMCFDDNTIDV